jgi:hypothetical protein
LQVIKLRVLAGREVYKAAGVSVGDVGQSSQLVGGQVTARDLDPLHLDALLPLRIGAELEAELLHLGLAEFPGAIFFDLLFVIIQLVLDVVRDDPGRRFGRLN